MGDVEVSPGDELGCAGVGVFLQEVCLASNVTGNSDLIHGLEDSARL